MAIRAGDLLCGRYLLEATIGRGGMGEVFSAQVVSDDPYNVNVRRGMRVAVKVVNRMVVDDLLMARLEREAQAARLIHSAYVPALLAVDRTPDESREGQEELFLVLQLLEGQSFSHRLKARGGYLSWEEVYRYGEDVLRGLQDAHRAGIVHRDLKPGNIFLARQPDGSERAMILDFGVCKLDHGDGDKLTVTGESLGTVSYMAPEQIRGASRVDERADLYSFAMVVFEALSGRLAHDATGQMAMLASKLERAARSIRDVATVPIPAGLEGVLKTCLSRKPADRYPSAEELLKVWSSLGKMRAIVQPRPAALATRSQSQPSFPHVGGGGAHGGQGGHAAHAGAGAPGHAGPGTETALSASAVDSSGRFVASGGGGRRVTLLIAAGAMAAALVVTGAVALHRKYDATRAAAAAVVTTNANANANASAAPADEEVPHVAIVSQVEAKVGGSADAASASANASAAGDRAIDVDELPSAPPAAPSSAASLSTTTPATNHPAKAQSAPSRGSHGRGAAAGKKHADDGFMSVAPF